MQFASDAGSVGYVNDAASIGTEQLTDEQVLSEQALSDARE